MPAPFVNPVALESWEYAHAYDVGIRRTAARWGSADRLSYQAGRNQPENLAGPAAAICEMAVAKSLGRYWSGHVWPVEDHHRFRDLPDVSPNVEVRRLRSRTGQAAVRSKDLGRGLNLVVAFAVPPEFRTVEILGWLGVEEAWEVGHQASYDSSGATRCVPVTALRPIDTFVAYPLAVPVAGTGA